VALVRTGSRRKGFEKEERAFHRPHQLADRKLWIIFESAVRDKARREPAESCMHKGRRLDIGNAPRGKRIAHFILEEKFGSAWGKGRKCTNFRREGEREEKNLLIKTPP